VDRGTALALTTAVGCVLAIQAPINSGLGRSIGSFQAAFVSFLVGTVLLLAVAAVAKGGLGALGHVGDIPHWYYLLGGVLGAAYVSTVLVTVRTLGAGALAAATICSQLTTAALIDQFGLLGVERNPLSVARVAGIGLLVAGTFLVVKS
jgi:transporter family-2 protein